jgi:enoyl-CoA hydratase/carnithine racemase
MLSSEAPASTLKKRQAEIDELFSGTTVEDIVARFKGLEIAEDDKLLATARKTMLHGSPTSLKISFEQFYRSKALSLKEAFQQELILSIQCCLHNDFAEGVRALLIDKDNAPRWSPAELEAVSRELVLEHFRAPWTDEHPLQDL